jgi:hypothetical protein
MPCKGFLNGGGGDPDAYGRSVPWTRRSPQPAPRTLHVLRKPLTIGPYRIAPIHAPTKSPGALAARSIVAVRAAHIAGSRAPGSGWSTSRRRRYGRPSDR